MVPAILESALFDFDQQSTFLYLSKPAKPEITKGMALAIQKDCFHTKLFGDERHEKLCRKTSTKDYRYHIDL
jgi:hypothetical protein